MPILIPNAPFDAPMGADEPVDAPADASMPSPVRDAAVVSLRRLSPACAGCVSPPRVPPDIGALIKKEPAQQIIDSFEIVLTNDDTFREKIQCRQFTISAPRIEWGDSFSCEYDE